MTISSKDNKSLKLLQKLSLKKYREQSGLFIVEGIRAVNDILALDSNLVEKVFITESKANLYPEAVIVKDDIFEKLTETVNGQGVLALVKKPVPKPPSSSHVLFLDGIRDPGNLGTLIRTACAAGYYDVYIRDCADPYAGKVVRSTMSAILKVNIIDANVSDIEKVKSLGYRIIAADMAGKSIFSSSPMRDKVCLVIGGEANGISAEVKEHCDEIYSLPMEGNIESLNAAISGGIMMYTIKFNKEK